MRVARLELTGVGPFEGAVFEIDPPKEGTTGELVFFEGPNGCGKTTIAESIAVMVSGHCARLDPTVLFTRPPLETCRRRWLVAPRARMIARHDGTSIDLSSGPEGGGQSDHANAAAEAIHFFQSAARAAAQPVAWAAFAYRAHHESASLDTPGPREIAGSPLEGALSFGAASSASKLLGQLLVNLDYARTKAVAYASGEADEERRRDLVRAADSRKEAIRRFETAFSKVLERRATIGFSIDEQAPALLLDDDRIPLDLLGEGLRSTMAWLADLLVRLERIHWVDTTRSPLDQEFWLILDEIDESLHPNMQAHVYPALRKLFPNARIYATTHSPFVIASAGDCVVFPIRPDKDHKVRGKIDARTLEPGQTLEYVTTEIFQAPDGFIDQYTRDLLDEHRRDIRRFRKTKSMDWDAFFARRNKLFELNDQVRTTVAIQEVKVRREVEDEMFARIDAREQQELEERERRGELEAGE